MTLVAVDVAAQQSPVDSTRRWFTSGSIGLIGTGGHTDPELLTLGVQWTGARRGTIVPDLAVGTSPRALSLGVVVLGGRAGAALPIALGSKATLLPAVGLSGIGGVGGGGGGGTWGYSTGASLVTLGQSGVGMRMGITWHRFDWDGSVWLVEVGIVRGPRPAAR